ncbi:MAG: phosphohistidine phosphatase SixA [Chthoniobacteraceae bacterium]
MNMELYFLRHADADTIAETDDARPISEKGEGQCKKVARFCESHGLTRMRVLSSPVLRAKQTAEIVVAHLGLELEIAPWLACGMRPSVATRHLEEYADEATVMIVGHEPDFSGLAAFLLGMSSGEQIEIRKASLTGMTVTSLDMGGARLDFSVPCRLM